MILKRTWLLLLLLVPLAWNSCKKEDHSNDETVSFKVEGALKQRQGDAFVNAEYYRSIDAMQVSGYVGTSEGVSVMISNFKGTGDYSGNDFLATYVASTDNPAINAYVNTNGSVRVSNFNNNTIRISFQFRGENAVDSARVITEGEIFAKVVQH